MQDTIIVQISNSDDKLTQHEWSRFIKDIEGLLPLYGSICFSGTSNGDVPWQKAVWVIHVTELKNIKLLHEVLFLRKEKYFQDFIAFTVGKTEFI